MSRRKKLHIHYFYNFEIYDIYHKRLKDLVTKNPSNILRIVRLT